MTIALDIGAGCMRALRREGGELVAGCLRAVYATVPDTSANVRLLEHLNLASNRCEGELLVSGDDALALTEVLPTPLISVFPSGGVPDDDPPARQLAAAMVEQLLPEPQHESEVCGLNVPTPQCSRGGAPERTAEFLKRVVQLRGYRPAVVPAGTALVLAEMESDQFTGLAFTFGAANCDAVLTHQGVQITYCSVPHGGDWINSRMAQLEERYAWDANGNRYLDTAGIERWKHSTEESIAAPTTTRGETLSQLYSGLIRHVLSGVAARLKAAVRMQQVPTPVNVVIGGGVARIAGFQEVFARGLIENELPIEVRSTRVVADEFAVARGCLIHAEVESHAA